MGRFRDGWSWDLQSASHSYTTPCVDEFRLSPANIRPGIEGVGSPR